MIAWNALQADTVLLSGASIAMPNRSRQVLLRLLLEPNRSVSTDQLADALWDDDSVPKSIRNSLSRFVSDLRNSLGDYGDRIETTPNGYRVLVEEDELDLDQLTAVLERDDPTELLEFVNRIGAGANSHLIELHGIEGIIRSHDELRVAVLEAAAQGLSNDGHHVESIAVLERAAATHPLHERFWELLMLDLDATGRTLDASRAGDRCQQALAEVGVAPSADIKRHQADLQTRLEYKPDAKPLSADTTKIPDPGTRFIGRIDDLRAVHQLVAEHRCVSIVGLGGTGKTRFALALSSILEAEATLHQVSFRGTDDPHLVVPLVAAAIGIPSPAEVDPIAFAQSIAHQQFVLVIDNAEHLLAACAELIAALIEHAPGTRLLVTSRQALGTPGEIVYPLAPLSLENRSGADDPSSAAELFIDRAPSRRPGAHRNEVQHNLAVIEQICQRLHGLPLAIEIAAAQLAFMPLEVLAARIGEALEAGNELVEPAVTAVESVLDWAWDRLTVSQQLLIARLSVFPSGWTFSSAQVVRAGNGSLAADLDRLVATHLVDGPTLDLDTAAASTDSAATDRYAMLEPVREFAAARLADCEETQVMRARLADWALATTARWSCPEHYLWSGPNDELHPESGNLIAAMAFLHEQERNQDLVTLGVASAGMMVNRGMASTVVRALTPHLEDTTIDAGVRGSAYFAVGSAIHAMGDLENLSALAREALVLADGQPHDWMAMHTGYFSVWSLVAPSQVSSEELSALSFDVAERSTSRRLNLGIASLYRAHVEFVSRNFDEALRLFREAEVLVEQPGRGLLVIEVGIALSLHMLGRHHEAVHAITNARSQSDTDDWHFIIDVIKAIVVGGAGEPERATTELTAAARKMPEAGAWGRAGIIQTAFAMLADYRGESELATELFASAMNRDILLLTVSISHVMNTRGISGDDAWLEVGIEFWTRIVPADSIAATATSTPQLMQWWASGDATTADAA